MDTAVKPAASGKTPTQIDRVVKITAAPAFKSFKLIQARLSRLEKSFQAALRHTLKWLVLTVVFTFALMAGFFVSYLVILFGLVKRVTTMRSFARKIGQGRLTVLSGISGHDEIADSRPGPQAGCGHTAARSSSAPAQTETGPAGTVATC